MWILWSTFQKSVNFDLFKAFSTLYIIYRVAYHADIKNREEKCDVKLPW